MLFRELKRRKVIRTCLLYILLCWGALQVGDILFPALGFNSDTASLYFLYLAIAGFPVTFALAWFFQITPEGIVRTMPFVERRVLSNIPPINDRRTSRAGHLFGKNAEQPDYSWILIAESGPLAGLSFGIVKEVVIGRSLECDLTVVSPHISRRHARLSLEDDELLIADLGSSNGTVVNGYTIAEKQALHHDDELRFHDIIFKINAVHSARRSAQQAADKTTFVKTSITHRNYSD